MSPQLAKAEEPALPERPAAAALAPAAPRPPPASQVEDPLYPSSDGLPMAESSEQLGVMVDGVSVLRNRYRERRADVFVGGDLLMYYQRGDPTKRVAPDVFVIFGVADGLRKAYRLWDEGKAPDFVLEVASKSTWREDVGRKRDLYERLGFREYWLFDPHGGFLRPVLQGLALEGGKYRELPARLEGGVRVLRSRVLELDLRAEGEQLRFRVPGAEENLRTLAEETDARRRAEAACRSAETRNEQLQAQIRALETRLADERRNSSPAVARGDASTPGDGHV